MNSMFRAFEYDIDLYAAAQTIPMDDEFRDATLGVSQESVDAFDATRVLNNLSSLAVTVVRQLPDNLAQCPHRVARILLVPGPRDGQS